MKYQAQTEQFDLCASQSEVAKRISEAFCRLFDHVGIVYDADYTVKIISDNEYTMLAKVTLIKDE